MADLVAASLDFIGFLGFFAAFAFSYKNFRSTRHISVVWMLVAVAMIFLDVFAFVKFLKWVDVAPQAIEVIEDTLFPAAIVSIFTAVLVSHEEFLKPASK